MNEEMKEQQDNNYDELQQQQMDYNYNTPQQEQSKYDTYNAKNQEQQANGFAIASLVLGLIALVTFCTCCVNVPCAILSIIFGIIHLTRGGEKGMAIFGLVTSGVSLVAMIIFWVVMLAFTPASANNSELNNYLKQYEKQFHNDSYNYDNDYTEDDTTF